MSTVPALVRPRDVPRLAALTARPVGGLRRQLQRHRSSLHLDVASLPTSAGRRVSEARMPGVFVIPESHRRYPSGGLLGPLLGWTGVATPEDMKRWPDLPLGAVVGRTGLEQIYDPILRGTDGRQCVYVTPAGTPARPGPYTPPRPGSTVRLALDLGLQRRLTGALATVLRGVPGQPRGDLGGSVVLDPRNGQVLAMASLPSYDSRVFGPPVHNQRLARLSRRPASPMLEHATQVAAPPGSTFKLVVAAANMRRGLVSPYRVLPGGGSWTLGNHTFGNWMTLPAQNLMEAIAWSNDVYFYQLAWALGPGPIIRTARSLGVGRPTGIDLPGRDRWVPRDTRIGRPGRRHVVRRLHGHPRHRSGLPDRHAPAGRAVDRGGGDRSHGHAPPRSLLPPGRRPVHPAAVAEGRTGSPTPASSGRSGPAWHSRRPPARPAS